MHRLLLASAVALALAAAGGTATAAPASLDEVELIPRDALFGNPERANVQMSPDGRYLSWVAPLEGTLNVWVAPADDPSAARAVTRDTARGIRSYFWSYLPDTLLYLRDTGGDEDFHLYAVDLRSGAARDLTSYGKTTARVVGVSRRHPGTVLVGMNDRDPQWHDLYRVDLASGERTLVEENTGQIGEYVADADYRLRFATRSRPDGGIDLLRRAGDDWEKYDEIPFEEPEHRRRPHPRQTLYLRGIARSQHLALFAIDTATGGAAGPRCARGCRRRAPTGHGRSAGGVGQLPARNGRCGRCIRADLKLERSGRAKSANTRSGRPDLIMAYSAADRRRYYRYDRDSGNGRTCSPPPGAGGKPLVPMWPLELESRDGKTLVSYLTLPAHADADGDGKADSPVPLVLLVHGGPWARDAYGYSGWQQWLANRGYAVLSVNYRGSTGFGKDFTNAGDGEWAAGMHDDLIDAVQWAVESGTTTADKVAIMGGSYGGYATWSASPSPRHLRLRRRHRRPGQPQYPAPRCSRTGPASTSSSCGAWATRRPRKAAPGSPNAPRSPASTRSAGRC